MPEVDSGAHDPRPVLDRRGNAVRGARPGLATAAALHGEHLMLGDLGLHRRDVDDLAPFGARDLAPAQGLPATGAPPRPVPHDLAGMVAELHRRPRLALRPAWLPAGLPPQRLRRRLRQPVRRWRPRGIPRVRLHLRGQALDLRLQPCQRLPQHRDLRVLPRDPRVPLRQQLPQPRIRSTKPRSIIGNARHLGHEPHYTTALPRPQIGAHRTCRSRQESAGDKNGVPTDLSSYCTQSCSVHGTILAIRSRDRPPEFRKG